MSQEVHAIQTVQIPDLQANLVATCKIPIVLHPANHNSDVASYAPTRAYQAQIIPNPVFPATEFVELAGAELPALDTGSTPELPPPSRDCAPRSVPLHMWREEAAGEIEYVCDMDFDDTEFVQDLKSEGFSAPRAGNRNTIGEDTATAINVSDMSSHPADTSSLPPHPAADSDLAVLAAATESPHPPTSAHLVCHPTPVPHSVADTDIVMLDRCPADSSHDSDSNVYELSEVSEWTDSEPDTESDSESESDGAIDDDAGPNEEKSFANIVDLFEAMIQGAACCQLYEDRVRATLSATKHIKGF
ncbi:hypothetical protein HK097_009862 [Rhizophlyctis rosea]|uniref:Uncharacterized protein n=1 Tax=Rhizophlyctis rosea TaxID=64517 RepID=A0AAD5S8B0_9FUNG|nr:hypothetical protein HK097_009862 [Rhizophlyctis rosea]